MKTVSIINGKGGSGKTTTALALASCLVEVLGGSGVLLVDADPQGSGAWASRRGEVPYDLAQESDPALLRRLGALDGYQVILADTPPAISDSVVQVLAQGSDLVILPTSTSPLELRELNRTVTEVLQPLGVNYKVLLNRVNSRRVVETLQVRVGLLEAGIQVFKQAITSRVALERFIVEGIPLTQTKGQSAQSAIAEYRAVTKELIQDLELGLGAGPGG